MARELRWGRRVAGPLTSVPSFWGRRLPIYSMLELLPTVGGCLGRIGARIDGLVERQSSELGPTGGRAVGARFGWGSFESSLDSCGKHRLSGLASFSGL